MKFGSHKAINGSLSVFLGFDIAGIVITVLGGVLPDILDRIIAGRNEWLFSRIHRKISHWWLLWGAILYLCHISFFPVIFQINTSEILWYLSFGSLLHIACDSLTMSGIPFLNPFKQSIGFRLFYTGSGAEYALVRDRSVILYQQWRLVVTKE
ncbi:MAG: metal-dependent hydrolase [Methanomethylovorans sp.]|nr:metal-dependent hydrolase [Methanomethylovorans sp.]